MTAITAASLGVPSTFLSGDAGIFAAAEALVPGIVTLPVSRGFGPATSSLSPVCVRERIREGVARALFDPGARHPASLAARWEVEPEFANPVEAYRGSFPGVDYPAPLAICPRRLVQGASDPAFPVVKPRRHRGDIFTTFYNDTAYDLRE